MINKIRKYNLKKYIALYLLMLIIVSVSMSMIAQKSIQANLNIVQIEILKSLEHYRQTLQNARWPAQRYEYYSVNERTLQKNVTIIETQMLQLSYGYDLSYFMLRSMKGQTRVEIQRGNLTKNKSSIIIDGEENIAKLNSGFYLRSCKISDEHYLCLIDIPIQRKFIQGKERNYILIAVPITDILLSIKYLEAKQYWFLPQLCILMKLNKAEHKLFGNNKSGHLFYKEVLIDKGVSVLASYHFISFVWFVIFITTGIFTISLIIMLMLAHYIKKRLNRKIEYVLMQSKLQHYEQIQVLVRGVKHDIKSPLSVLNMISTTEKDPERSNFLTQVVKRLNSIIQDLDYKGNKIDNHESVYLPLDLILENAVHEKRRELKDINLLYVNELENNDIWTKGPYSDFTRIISNLVNNSYEASLENKNVTIKLTADDSKTIVVKIIDNGCGIEGEYLEKVYDKTFTHNKKQGTGFGLYHAKKIIDKMGGKINISSEVGEGTIVDLCLQKIEKPAWGVNELNLKNKKNIVLVDDEAINESVWLNKITNNNIDFKYIKHPSEFEGKQIDINESIILFDNTFNHEYGLGLRYIDENRIQNCILVTSDWELHEIQEAASRLNIKLLGKEFINFIEVIE